ncbi:MAG: hypothetical protein WBV45_07940 [Lutimonas sp.]
MKRFFILMIMMTLTYSVSAQTMPSVSTDDVKSAGMEVAAEQSPDVTNQIMSALKTDEGVQKETIDYLKNNPETTNAISKIIADNKDSIDGVMKSVLGDSALTSAAVDWIANNPEMLNKVMKLAGM